MSSINFELFILFRLFRSRTVSHTAKIILLQGISCLMLMPPILSYYVHVGCQQDRGCCWSYQCDVRRRRDTKLDLRFQVLAHSRAFISRARSMHRRHTRQRHQPRGLLPRDHKSGRPQERERTHHPHQPPLARYCGGIV
jgi:hypothetical protein